MGRTINLKPHCQDTGKIVLHQIRLTSACTVEHDMRPEYRLKHSHRVRDVEQALSRVSHSENNKIIHWSQGPVTLEISK